MKAKNLLLRTSHCNQKGLGTKLEEHLPRSRMCTSDQDHFSFEPKERNKVKGKIAWS
jgi:hypothetical protein